MAVYTQLAATDLEILTDAYDIGRVVACDGIAEGTENTNYLLTATGGRFVLTLFERRTDAADLPFFLGLMDHLAARGVPCPRPFRGRDGAVWRTLAGRPAALVSRLDGAWPRHPTAEQCRAVGTALADLHVTAAGFGPRRANTLSVDAWGRLATKTRPMADRLQPGLGAELIAEAAFLAARWPADLPRGTIHGDLFPDNVFFDGERLSGLIDFYFACDDLLAYDIAVCLNAWCFDRAPAPDRARARALIDGYRSRRRLTAAERRALPVLARAAALRFLLTRLLDLTETPADALVTPKDPLECHGILAFHRVPRAAADYGLEDGW